MKNLPIDPKWREKQILKEIENMDLSDESNDIERSPDMIPDFNNGLPRLAMWIYRASPYAVIIAALVLAFCAGRAFGADLPPIVEEPRQECSTEPVRIKGRFCVRISDGQITHPSQCCIVAPDGGTFTPADPQEPPGREHDDEEGDI